MCLRITHLHRARVRAQVEPAAVGVLQVDVEGVLHRTRRVVLGVVQRREAHPVGLDLGAFSDVEAHRAEDRLDPLDHAADGVDAALAALPAWQGDVERLRLQLRLELGRREALAARRQRRLDAGLELVDVGAAGLLLLDAERAQSLEQFGHAAGLAQVTRLGVFEFGGGGRRGEIRRGRSKQGIEIVHRDRVQSRKGKKRGRQRVTASRSLTACRPAGRQVAISSDGPSPWRRCCQRPPGRARRDRPGPCGRCRSAPSSGPP